MITGFNTDIEVDGHVYHVQTEDKGLSNPVIETLVYTGGQIVCARKTSYADLVDTPTFSEAEVHVRMEGQHRALIREIRDGQLMREDLEPFGWNIITNQSFDEVVHEFLASHVPLDKLRLELLEPKQLTSGERATLKLTLTEETSERPIGGAGVVVRAVDQNDAATEISSTETDLAGRAEVSVSVPAGVAVVVCEAEAGGSKAEVSCKVKRRRAAASAPRA
jgi:hypothetical protein